MKSGSEKCSGSPHGFTKLRSKGALLYHVPFELTPVNLDVLHVKALFSQNVETTLSIWLCMGIRCSKNYELDPSLKNPATILGTDDDLYAERMIIYIDQEAKGSTGQKEVKISGNKCRLGWKGYPWTQMGLQARDRGDWRRRIRSHQSSRGF